MDRFCDYLVVMRHKGDIYNPFAKRGEAQKVFDDEWHEAIVHDDHTIYTETTYQGPCKHRLMSQNSMMSVSDRGTYTITINERDLDIDTRDTAYLFVNSDVRRKIKMTILEVTPYERNTVIHAMNLKDGDNE